MWMLPLILRLWCQSQWYYKMVVPVIHIRQDLCPAPTSAPGLQLPATSIWLHADDVRFCCRESLMDHLKPLGPLSWIANLLFTTSKRWDELIKLEQYTSKMYPFVTNFASCILHIHWYWCISFKVIYEYRY